MRDQIEFCFALLWTVVDISSALIGLHNITITQLLSVWCCSYLPRHVLALFTHWTRMCDLEQHRMNTIFPPSKWSMKITDFYKNVVDYHKFTPSLAKVARANWLNVGSFTSIFTISFIIWSTTHCLLSSVYIHLYRIVYSKSLRFVWLGKYWDSIVVKWKRDSRWCLRYPIHTHRCVKCAECTGTLLRVAWMYSRCVTFQCSYGCCCLVIIVVAVHASSAICVSHP